MLNYKLSTFLELCETKNYTKTAEKLHMTQPAVTQHIKYLEQYYGTKLFYYDEKKRLHLTIKDVSSAHMPNLYRLIQKS